MNMFEEAQSIHGMLKLCGMTQMQIAQKIGVSQSYVANKLRLLRFSPEVREAILEAKLCERQARMLLRLDSDDDILFAIRKMSGRNMTVAESEVVVDMLYECEAPKKLERADRRERIECFEKFINESLSTLSCLGISVDKRIETVNDKKYITILLEG